MRLKSPPRHEFPTLALNTLTCYLHPLPPDYLCATFTPKGAGMPQSLTCWETARRLNVKPLWVHRLIDRGDLKVVGDGVTEDSVNKLLRRRQARKRPAGYVSIKRASAFLGVSRQRVQQLCNSGALLSRSVEGRVWIDGESVFKRAEAQSRQ